MKKIFFDSETFIWKAKLKEQKNKNAFLKIAKKIIDYKDSEFDAFSYKSETKNVNFNGEVVITNKLDLVIQKGIDFCKSLYNETGSEYNKVNFETWVNVVRSKNPKQINYKHNEIADLNKFHTHSEINKNNGMYIPQYTFVYYIQLPEIMENEDGVLYFKGKNGGEYYIKPNEDEIIIMPGDMPHHPNNAPMSKKDRIVLAGNVGFENIKKIKSIF